MATTPKADRARALRALRSQLVTERGGDRAADQELERLVPGALTVVLAVPGDAEAPEDHDMIAPARRALGARGVHPDAVPGPEFDGPEMDEAPEDAMTEHSSRTQEICRRLRQLADDLAALDDEEPGGA